MFLVNKNMLKVKLIQNCSEVQLPFKLNLYGRILEQNIHNQYEIIINVSLFIYR